MTSDLSHHRVEDETQTATVGHTEAQEQGVDCVEEWAWVGVSNPQKNIGAGKDLQRVIGVLQGQEQIDATSTLQARVQRVLVHPGWMTKLVMGRTLVTK